MHDKEDDKDTQPDEKLIQNNVKKQKTPLSQRIKLPKLPPFDQIRKLLKPPVALLIGLIMCLSDRCREAIGQGALLTTIVLVFYFPSRTFGIVLEDVIYGTFGALVAAAYCFLAMYTADLARDPNNPIPVQPKSSGVLVVYMFVGIFFVTYIRTKITRANFACINAGILLSFGLTDSSIMKGFQPAVIWAFLIPIALGGGIAVAVSGLIWPADSMSNYMTVLLRTLEGYNSFFKTHSNGFLSRSTGESVKSTLSTLHQSLDNSTLFLIDCKRAVRRDILFSHLSGEDVSALTRMVKGMRACLHGVGLAQILRKELDNANSSAFENLSEEQREIEKDTLEEAVQELQFLFQQISDSCYNAMSECIGRLSALQGPPNRTPLNSILWPFPRFFISSKCPAYEGTRTEPEELEDLVGKLDIRAGKSVENLLKLHHRIGATRTYGGLHLISMYRYNLKIYACKMAALLRFVKELELKRQKRRIWFPTNKAFRKWFRSREIDTNMGGDSGDYAQQGAELTLVRTNTRTDAGALDVENARSSESAFVKTPAGKLYYRDPDVDPPATAAQIFWDRLYSIRRWFAEVDTFFAFKTAAGTVLLALPIYLPESAAWYYEWRGQWALITLTLWMFPMTGMFLYSVLLRLLGTVFGGVFGIVVWEMTQGNPYGIAVVMFVVFVIFFYLMAVKPTLRVLSIMTVITILLVVIYEHNYVVGAVEGNDPVWTLAGKRMLLVVIGVAACAILSLIPYPVTGRVELRKRLSQTIRDIGKLYGILAVHMVQPNLAYQEATAQQAKGFRKLALNIRRQVADERSFHKLAVFEPPLRGRFPKESYETILEKVDNMADLVFDMGHVIHDITGPWRQQIASTLTSERRDYLASIMTTLKLLSATLSAKMALPPYLIAPGEARERFSRALERNIRLRIEDINNPSFLPYTTYVVLSATFVTELQALLEAVEDLVGIEDPEEWLRQNYY